MRLRVLGILALSLSACAQSVVCHVPGDGVTLEGVAIAQCLAANPLATVTLPGGNHLLNNSVSAGLTIPPSFHGVLDLRGTRLVCNTQSKLAAQCVWANGVSGVTVQGLTVGYSSEAVLPLPRNACSPNNALLVQGSSNLRFEDTIIEASPGVCIWNTNSTDITYRDTHVANCSADGLHFENTTGSSTGTLVINTGDDAIAATQIAGGTNNDFSITDSHITNSHARGIAVVGPGNVRVQDFYINGTAYSGIAADTQAGYSTSSGVKFSNGLIYVTGTAAPGAGTSGFPYGIEVDGTSNIIVDGVDVTGAGNDAAFVYGGASNVVLSRITSHGAGNAGFQVSNAQYVRLSGDQSYSSASSGFSLSNCAHCEAYQIKSDHDGAYGVFGTLLGDFNASDVVVRDCAGKNQGLGWEMESPAGTIEASGVTVTDDRIPATCYKVGSFNVGGFTLNVASTVNAQIPVEAQQ